MAQFSEEYASVQSARGYFKHWVLRFADWRNRKIMDPAFQQWATSFLPTRFLVRKRQKQLFDLTAGFVYSQVLFSCVSLGLFELLKGGAQSKPFLSRSLELDEKALDRLLLAAQSLDLISIIDEKVRLADLGAAVVANPGISAMVKHHAMFYRDLRDPVLLLKGGVQETELARFWGYATSQAPGRLSRDDIDDYSHLMAVSQDMVSKEIIAAYPFQKHQRLLDVGGGEGAFVQAVGSAYRSLRLEIFDLPAVAERAKQNLGSSVVSARLAVHAGSFFEDDLPKGADIISLVRVLYDHDNEKVLKILTRVRDALPQGGTLLIAEPMRDMPGAEAMGAAYFGFYLMAMKSGRARNFSDFKTLLQKAGFSSVLPLKTRSPVITSALIAK